MIEGLEKYHVSNYSIYLKGLEENKPLLLGYFKYSGQDFDSDMAKMIENPTVRKWEDTAGEECLVDQSHDGKSVWWIDMEEVFYHPGRTDRKVDESKVQRYGMVIGFRLEIVDYYKLLQKYKYSWPEVLNKFTEGDIRNYAIYLYQLSQMQEIF